MKTYTNFTNMYEEAMTTASAGFGTGDVVNDDDMRVPSGDIDITKRKKMETTNTNTNEQDPNDVPEEDASELIDLPGDEVADKQAKAQPGKGTAGDSADPSGP